MSHSNNLTQEEFMANSLRVYSVALTDIQNDLNLEKHKADINEAIAYIKELIETNKRSGLPTAGFEDLINEFYYLVYLIAEKTE